jgi:hypothetical protein
MKKGAIGSGIVYSVCELVRAVVGGQELATPQQAYQAFMQPTKTVEQVVQPQENGLVAKLRGFVPGSVAEAGESYNHLIETYLPSLNEAHRVGKPIKTNDNNGNSLIIDTYKVEGKLIRRSKTSKGTFTYWVIGEDGIRDSNGDGIFDQKSRKSIVLGTVPDWAKE